MKVEFTVDTTPYPQPRPRVARGHAYEPARIKEYKEMIRTFARIHMRGQAPSNKLVSVMLTFRRNKRLGSRMYGDIDNLEKAVLDALSGICYTDDALIIKMVSEKESDTNEGVDVTVSDEE